jgi:hypothetical protein
MKEGNEKLAVEASSMAQLRKANSERRCGNGRSESVEVYRAELE